MEQYEKDSCNLKQIQPKNEEAVDLCLVFSLQPVRPVWSYQEQHISDHKAGSYGKSIN